MNEKLKEKLKDVKTPHNFARGKKNQDTVNEIIRLTSFLDDDAPFSERFYCIMNDITEKPICSVCKERPLKFKNKKYDKYCSASCSNKDHAEDSSKRMRNHTQKKIKEVFRKKYGGDSPFVDKNVREKIKQTMKERHGVEYASQNPEIAKKISYTNKHVVDNKKRQERMKETCLEKYGVKYAIQHPEIHNRILQTNLKRYGVEHATQNPKIKAKIIQTNLERYGYENPTQHPEIKKRIIETNRKRYYTDGKLPFDKDTLNQKHNIDKKPIYVIAKEYGISDSTLGRYFRKYDIPVQRFSTSQHEQQMAEWLTSLGINFIQNDRKILDGLELDFYLPDYDLALEMDGLYWHSTIFKEPSYHLNKTLECEKKGIRLIHIWEHEWVYMQDKCKQTLLHFFGLSEKGVPGRKVKIKEISWRVAKEFLNQYHLLNSGTSGFYRSGAFDPDGNLIAIMVFGKLDNGSGTELKRFVTDKKNNPGVASKLFKHSVDKLGLDNITAFVDRRWFTGLVKSHIGFEIIGYTSPTLWYGKDDMLFHRRFITKQKLIDDYGFPVDMTKREMLEYFGFFQIYDAGKLKLFWTR